MYFIQVIKSRRIRWVGHVAHMGEKRIKYQVLVGKSEGKRPLGRPKHRAEDHSTMVLKEIGWKDGDWINLAPEQGKVADSFQHSNEPWVP
jgi:hypothetical protein